MKLLRPLHRQARRRKNTAVILNCADIAQQLAVPADQVTRILDQRGIPYHTDSRGEVWVSVNEPLPAEPQTEHP